MRILLELVFLCIFIFIFGCGPGAGDGEADATDVHEEPDGTPEEVVDTREEDVASDSGEEDGSHPDVECFRDEECNDDDPCTADTCNLAYGACEHETLDADGDGYRAAKVGDTECGGMDCDDSRDDVYPGADLFCDGEDHDCSGRPDFDEDRDGYLSAELCSGTGDDCDDTNPDAYPGALTDCQAFDADCDGRVENDLDGDGHIGMSCGGNDCDDEDDAVYRGAFELTCDGKDTDCNGAMDGFEDADHDGYANEDCVAPGEEVDCNDGNGAIFPGATEVCDMIDQDCDGTWADGGADDDLDGYLDDDCGGNDCDDTREDVFPDAPEVCNDGVDQDCDGLVDGFTIMLDDVRITSDGIGSYSPALVWTGSEYGVSLKHGGGEDAEIYFVRISEAGSKTGTDVRITNHGGRSYYPSLVWTGSEYGVSWCDDRDGNYEIYFTRISDDGSKIGSDVRVTNDGGRSYYPSLVWTGSEYGVSWCDDRDGNYEIYFTRISDDGSNVGSDVRVTNDGGRSYYPSLVRLGSGYGVSWEDDRDGNEEIYFARISDTGDKIESDVRITSDGERSLDPSLVWTGSEYGVSWHDYRVGNWEIYFARVSGEGDKIGSDVRISDAMGWSNFPSLVWNGSEYGVSWEDDREDNHEIYISRISVDGTEIGDEVRITNYEGASWSPSLVWTGSEYSVSWYDSRNDQDEIYFNRVGMCD